MSTRFAVVDSRVNARNRGATDEFVRLAMLSTQRKLKPVETKRFARLQTQLMKAGVIVPLTKKLVTDQARAIYNALPWWKKLWLRARFYARNWRTRFEWLKLRLRS